MKRFLAITLLTCSFAACGRCGATAPGHLGRAKATLDSIYKWYGVDGSFLLRENHPFDADYKAGYLAEGQAAPNPYSYLWPFSGTLSAATAILGADPSYRSVIDGCILPGLARYLDTTRMPVAYAAYVDAGADRFYDDNLWLGIDLCDIYEATGDRKYLAEAERIWEFIGSGMDDVLGGGTTSFSNLPI